MRMAVVVVPFLFVKVSAVPRRDALQRGGEVVDEPGLKFDGREGSGRSNHEQVNESVSHGGAADELRDGLGQIDEVVLSASPER